MTASGLAVSGAVAPAAENVRSLETYAGGERTKEGLPPRFKSKLRITKLETLLVKPRWLFLKVHTDEGIVGWGEPVTEGRAKTCAEAVAQVGPAVALALDAGPGRPLPSTVVDLSGAEARLLRAGAIDWDQVRPRLG